MINFIYFCIFRFLNHSPQTVIKVENLQVRYQRLCTFLKRKSNGFQCKLKSIQSDCLNNHSTHHPPTLTLLSLIFLDHPLLSPMVRSHLICLKCFFFILVFCRLISARGRLSPSVCPRLRLSTTATVRTAGREWSWHPPEPGGRCCSTQMWQQKPGRHVSLSQKLSGGKRSWCEIHCSCYTIHCRSLYCCTVLVFDVNITIFLL